MATQTHRESLLEQYRKIRRRHGVDDIVHRLRRLEEELRSGGKRSVLRMQIEEARRQGIEGRERLGLDPPSVLILTVGTSPEPLLLAVAFHAPRRVALLMTEELDKEALRTLEELWDRYHETLDTFPFSDERLARRQVMADPADVFQAVRYLAKAAGEEQDGVVLDISGAKKSMIAGSFLAAGYLDLEATYVDFASYDSVLRRPEPGSSRLCTLPNPYRLFRLKERQRLARAFDQRHYGEAKEILEDLLASLAEKEVATVLGESAAAAERQRLGVLLQVCRVYLDWSEGFYKDAHIASARIEGFEPPKVVELLAEIWPERDRPSGKITRVLAEKRFFHKPAWALGYFTDLLVWNDSVEQKKNPRSSFLRLFGGIEALIFFGFHVFGGRGDGFLLDLEEEKFRAFAQKFAIGKFNQEQRWRDHFQESAVTAARYNSFLALGLLGGELKHLSLEAALSTARSLEEKRLEEELGADLDVRAFQRESRGLLPSAWASLASSPLAASEFSELISKKTGFNAFRTYRNKATHWLAPVPLAMTTALRDLFGRFVEILVPKIVEELQTNPREEEDLTDLMPWSERLLAVASGAEPEPGLRPMTFAEATRQAQPSLGSREETTS